MRRIDLTRAHGTRNGYRDGCCCGLCRAAECRHSRKYRAAHPERISERNRRWAAAHPEYAAEHARQWRTDHPEKNYEYGHRYYVSHPERFGRNAEASRKWRADNPEGNAAKARRHRARKRGATGTHTAADIQAQYARQGGKCFWGRKCNPDCALSLKDGYHVDYVIPLVGERASSNGPENLVLACPSCNMKKRAKDPMDFAGVML